MEIREATVGELAYLRSEGQASRLALAGTENPPIVFQCVINQAFTTHDRVSEFLYDTATGDYTDVLPGMTVWISVLRQIPPSRLRRSGVSSPWPLTRKWAIWLSWTMDMGLRRSMDTLPSRW